MVYEFWQSLNPAQAQLLAGLFTLFSAIIVAFVGPWVIGKRFSDLDDAAEVAKNTATSFSQVIQDINKKFEESDKEISDAIGSLQQVVARLELQSIDQMEEKENSLIDVNQPVPGDQDNRAKIRDDWHAIRDRIEEIANSKIIHGRTRNRIAAMDRRNYTQKLDELTQLSERDRLRGEIDFTPFRRALEIWNKYRANYNGLVTQDDIDEMNRLRAVLVN